MALYFGHKKRLSRVVPSPPPTWNLPFSGQHDDEVARRTDFAVRHSGKPDCEKSEGANGPGGYSYGPGIGTIKGSVFCILDSGFWILCPAFPTSRQVAPSPSREYYSVFCVLRSTFCVLFSVFCFLFLQTLTYCPSPFCFRSKVWTISLAGNCTLASSRTCWASPTRFWLLNTLTRRMEASA